MSLDSFVGAAACPSPYRQAMERIAELERDLAAARKALHTAREEIWKIGAIFRALDEILAAEQAAPAEPQGDGGHTV